MDVEFYVLVPVYNVEQYICQCIESVLKQTYPYFKLILVDDGTPDRSGLICDEYAARDPRIHVIHKENQGLISARRAAIDYCNEHFADEDGFFVFLDSDDMLKQNALQIIAKTVQENDCDVVVYGIERVCNGEFIGLFDKNPFIGTITDKRELYLKMFGDMNYNPLCRKAIKCSLMETVDYSRYYTISNGEDLLQDIPVYKKCRKVVFIPDILYAYTVNLDSITYIKDYGKYRTDSTVRAEVWQFLQTEGVLTDSDKQKYIRYCQERLKECLLIVGQFDTTYCNIKREFAKMREDAYYSMLVEKNEVEDMLLNMFKRRNYGMLFLAYRCMIIINRLRSMRILRRRQRK